MIDVKIRIFVHNNQIVTGFSNEINSGISKLFVVVGCLFGQSI